MAESLLLASKAVFAAAGCWLGVHLLKRARRPDAVESEACACALICFGGLGLLAFAGGPHLAGHSVRLARALMITGDALERLSVLGLAIFLWRVLGGARGARMAVLGVVLSGIAAVWMLVAVVQRWPEPLLSLPLRVASQLSFAAPFVWAVFEAAALYRRSRQGADPLEANRNLHWMLGSASFAAICGASVLALLLPAGSAFGPALSVLRALLYLLLAVLVLLAFAPPTAHQRGVRGGSRSARGAASGDLPSSRELQSLAPARATGGARRIV